MLVAAQTPGSVWLAKEQLRLHLILREQQIGLQALEAAIVPKLVTTVVGLGRIASVERGST